MSDLELRLTGALRHGADAAPNPTGLAAGARRRARVRRRNRLGGVAAAVLTVAVPTVVVALGVSGHRTSPADPSSMTGAQAGFRPESWHGVTVRVPAAWREGSQSAWCVTGPRAPVPTVQRPRDPDSTISCDPVNSYGVRFSVAEHRGLDWPVAEQHSNAYPDGAWVGGRERSGVSVLVATPSARLTRRILDSIIVTSRVRAYGCASTSRSSGQFTQAVFVSVCSYDARGRLDDGRTLDLLDSTTARADIQSAPADEVPGCPVEPTRAVVRLTASDLDATIDLDHDCLYVGPELEQHRLPGSVRDLLSSPPSG